MNSSDDSLLLIAADQINRGGPMALDSVRETSERRKQAYTLAELNLQAGRCRVWTSKKKLLLSNSLTCGCRNPQLPGIKAMKMSNFDMAFEIFDHGRLKVVSVQMNLYYCQCPNNICQASIFSALIVGRVIDTISR